VDLQTQNLAGKLVSIISLLRERAVCSEYRAWMSFGTRAGARLRCSIEPQKSAINNSKDGMKSTVDDQKHLLEQVETVSQNTQVKSGVLKTVEDAARTYERVFCTHDF
jgi:hypothetical protein